MENSKAGEERFQLWKQWTAKRTFEEGRNSRMLFWGPEIMARPTEKENLLHGWLERGWERNSFRRAYLHILRGTSVKTKEQPKVRKGEKINAEKCAQNICFIYILHACSHCSSWNKVACRWSSYKQTTSTSLLQLFSLLEEVTMHAGSLQISILKAHLAKTEGMLLKCNLSFRFS